MTSGVSDITNTDDPQLARYAGQTWVTNPGQFRTLYEDLPRDLAALCRAIQGVLTHYSGGAIADHRLGEIDTVAAVTLRGETEGFDQDPRFRPSGEIHSYSAAGFHSVMLP